MDIDFTDYLSLSVYTALSQGFKAPEVLLDSASSGHRDALYVVKPVGKTNNNLVHLKK